MKKREETIIKQINNEDELDIEKLEKGVVVYFGN